MSFYYYLGQKFLSYAGIKPKHTNGKMFDSSDEVGNKFSDKDHFNTKDNGFSDNNNSSMDHNLWRAWKTTSPRLGVIHTNLDLARNPPREERVPLRKYLIFSRHVANWSLLCTH